MYPSSGFSNSQPFANPFAPVGSVPFPTDFRQARPVCEEVYLRFSPYKAARNRVLSYFLTEIEVIDDSETDRKWWKEYLEGTLGILDAARQHGIDWDCYGNGFSSLYVPFLRWLSCPTKRCGVSFQLKEMLDAPNVFKVQLDGDQFRAQCPRCDKTSTWRLDDRPDDTENRIKVKHWAPQDIELVHEEFSGETDYFWRIPEDYKAVVKRGVKSPLHMQRVSEPVLRAIARNELFMFRKNAIFHSRAGAPSGVRSRGYGIPRVLSDFRQIVHTLYLQMYNEAICRELTLPTRVISPAAAGTATPGGQSVSPGQAASMGILRNEVGRMMARRNRNPLAIHFLPFAIDYKLLGAEANQLAPAENLDQAYKAMFSGADVWVELFDGSMQMEAVPTAIRLHESANRPVLQMFNGFIQWAADAIAVRLGRRKVKVRLKSTTIADDAEKQMMGLQLMQGQQLSGRSGLGMLGFDWENEQKQLAEEAGIQQKLQARLQEESQQAGEAQAFASGQPQGGGGGAPAPGGAPAGGDPAAGGQPQPGAGLPVTDYLQSIGNNTPQSLDDVAAAATQLASQLLTIPEGVKDSQLRMLRKENPVLHGAVRQEMDSLRNQHRMQSGGI